MNKTSIVFILIGIAVLGGIGFFFFKNQPEEIETPNDMTVEVTIEYSQDSSFTPKTIQATEGQKIVLKISSEIADEIHLHGYDISREVEAGGQVTMEFTADKTGRFEIELEESEIEIGVIEVYPK